MKSFVVSFLKSRAKKVLKKYHPMIIGVTGTVGKTSTKEAICACLRKFSSVRESHKNYNNEIGLPLSILGLESGGGSPLKWARVLKDSALNVADEPYPEILILEMAADKPGDMDYLLSIARPKIGVLTAISPVHLEQFKTIDDVGREKRKLLEALPDDGWAIINGDEPIVRDAASYSKAQVFSYGFSDGVDLMALEIKPVFESHQIGGGGSLVDEVRGLSFKIKHQGSLIPFFLPGVLGDFQVYAALAGIACGLKLGINPVDLTDSLLEFNGPPGRMRVIGGVKNTTIIDDTYNSSPLALSRALEVLGGIKIKGKRIAVLGDMLELGALSVESHLKAGNEVAQRADILITIGERARDIGRGAEEGGLGGDFIFNFSDVIEAAKFLQSRIVSGDFILVKGSQGMRMEKVVKEIMAEPERAGELLVRQDESWLGK